MEEKTNKKSSLVFVIFSVIFVLLNSFLSFLNATLRESFPDEPEKIPYVVGGIIGGAFILPIFVVLISLIFKSNRNKRTVLKVFLITSIVAFLGNLVSVIDKISKIN